MAAAAKRRDLVSVPRFVLHLPRILGAFSAFAFYLKYGQRWVLAVPTFLT